MEIVQGDLLKLALAGQFDLILHGCNCFCTMGKGIALSIKQHFPEAYAADQATEKGSREKLGSYSSALVERGDARFTIINAYTQFDWRGRGVKVDYDAVRRIMRSLAKEYPNAKIGYPKIGAGLAGGDWNLISLIIDEELAGLDHRLVEYVAG
ncbi:macro domain-containing protein [Oryzifoliimicrobium ureilyticus]|uniref:macro domain-containing protein n=1 Tax=Oryzifoliimicrobium ureilyticus TaxID=3113724 RepID=UPI00307682FB